MPSVRPPLDRALCDLLDVWLGTFDIQTVRLAIAVVLSR